jgi:hypothetical protein
MTQSQPPPGFFQIDGKSPDGMGRDQFVIPLVGNFQYLDENRLRQKMLEAALIPEVLDKPSGIWEDLISSGKTGWLCYSGRASGRLIRNSSINVPCPPSQVFAIYVRETRAHDGQLIVDWWEWVPSDPRNPNFPEEYDARYGKQLWPI